MIIWYRGLFTDKEAGKHLNKVKRKLEKGERYFNLYAICKPSNEVNMFDIIAANELCFPHYQNNKIKIIGLAFGRDSAIKLMSHIVEEVYQKTNDVAVWDYYTF